MDKRPGVLKLAKPDKVESLLKGLRDGTLAFKDFELLFVNFITSDIKTAGRLAEGLKHRRFHLSPLEDAHKQRLIGRFYEARSNHKLAISWTRRALEAFERLGGGRGRHMCRRLLFSSHAHLGRYGTAEYYANQALADPTLSPGERVKIHSNLGGLAYRVHNYTTSLDHYTKAIRLLEKDEEKTRAVLLYNLGLLYVCLNKFAEAEENFAEASELFQTFHQEIYQAHTLQSFGHLYTILGQYFHAETKLKNARELYLKGGDQTGSTLCDIELIRLDTRLNRFERILERIPHLLETFKRKGRSPEVGLIYYNGVAAAIALSEFELAEDYLSRAGRIFKREQNSHFIANCTMLEGVLLWQEGKVQRGLGKILKARESFAKSGIRELELECLIYAHRIRNRSGDQLSYRRLRFLLKHPLSPTVRIQGLIMLSDYWYQRAQIKRSITSLFEAVNIVEESRASITNQSLRASFFKDKTEIYELLIERLLEWKNPQSSANVFRAMELSRSRQMMEMLSRREALPPVINRDDPLLMELHRLDLRIKQLNRRLEVLSAQSVGATVDKQVVLDEISHTRGKIVQVRKAMRHENRLSLFYPLEFRPEDIRRYLRPDSLLVIFYLGKKMLYRIELDQTSLRTYQHPLPEDYHRDFNQMLHIISNRIVPRMNRAMRIAARFSNIMVPDKLEGVSHITFVLHKALQRFPLPLLTRKNGRYLIETHTLNQCPNLPVFYFTQREQAANYEKCVFFFSDKEEDPKAPERDYLVKRFPQALTIAALDDERVESSLREGNFIHFAGHCVFDKRQPDRSYLQLGGKKMSLATFARLGFQGRPFLNLAACQSGWMVLSAGNEPHGFVIGSFAAGANSLLAGLWEVDDEATGQWMNIFYKHFHLGLAPAYQRACLQMMRDHEDPYLWAGFSLLGQA